MPDTNIYPDDFLASAADLVSAFAYFADSGRRRYAEHRRDPELLQGLSSRLSQAPATDPTPPFSTVPVAAPPQTVVGDVAAVADPRFPAQARGGHQGRRGRQYCQCGHCKWCVDNLRWERIYNEKFADPTYYSHVMVRHNSTLAEAR